MYGCIGPFCFGNDDNDTSKTKPMFDIKMNNIKSTLLNSITETVSVVKDTVIVSQVQNVTIKGYIGNGPDIIISQNLNLKNISNSKLSSVINDNTLSSISNDMDSQLQAIQDINPVIRDNPDNNELFTKIRKNITDIVKSDSTKKTLQTKITSAISIQDQNIYINFSNKVSDLTLLDSKPTKGPDGRPVIEITQNLVNNIYVNTVLKSLTSTIINNDKIVGDCLSLEKKINPVKHRSLSMFKSSMSYNDGSEITQTEIIIIVAIIIIIIFFFVKYK